MKRILIGLFVLFSAQIFITGRSMGGTPLGGTPPEDPKIQEELRSNVIDFRDWMMKQLSQFPKTGERNTSFASRNYALISKTNRVFSANQYNQAAKSDWVKAQVMDGLSTLSQQLAKTAGTAFALNSAKDLKEYARQLKQSDDLQFQEIGTLYTQEAQALQTGGIQVADQAANQVSAVPKPYVSPGYRPTQQESALVQAFNQVIGTVIAGLGGILGTFAVSQLLQALGISNLNSLLGTGQMTGSSIALGQNPGAAFNYAGANVVQTGGGAIIQQMGNVNVKPRQSQDSANAGGAPPAQ